MYIAQGSLIQSLTALKGVDAQLKLLDSDTSVTKDETFVLLEEYGSILQVDIIDTINRSTKRGTALDRYIKSLATLNERMKKKEEELNERLDSIKKDRREDRKKVRGIEREIRKSEKEGDYVSLGSHQTSLTKAQAKLAETETREKEIKRTLDVYESLLRVGEKRLGAISKNRQILIAGVHVIDVPGVEDLGLIMEE